MARISRYLESDLIALDAVDLKPVRFRKLSKFEHKDICIYYTPFSNGILADAIRKYNGLPTVNHIKDAKLILRFFLTKIRASWNKETAIRFDKSHPNFKYLKEAYIWR